MQQNWTSILPKIKSRYRSGKNSLAQEFFVPCISECVRYRRAAGYFSSSALKSWLGALPRIANDPKIKFELLVSPQIPAADLIVLKTLTDSTERKNHLVKSIDKIIDNIIDFETEPKDTQLRLKLFAWLIANEQLELKFGFIDGNEFTSDSATDDNLIYHEKFGIIDFPDGQVSFVGSANETERGHNRNHEYIHVFRSTEPTEKNRITEMIFDFEETWHGKTYGLIVLALSDDSIKKLISVAPRERPIFDKKEEKQNESFNTLWNHQKLAVTNFLKEKHGIIEMATGTGKTRTAIEILTQLNSKNDISEIIISTHGTDLLNQWDSDMLDWCANNAYKLYRHYDTSHQLQSFALAGGKKLILISREALRNLFDFIEKNKRKRMIIIHDEVHGLGSPNLRSTLATEHESLGYTLGLSATPEREYDNEGTTFLTTEIGDIIEPRYEIKNAIKDGILCEFDYIPLNYEVTTNDKKRISDVYKHAAVKKKEGHPLSQEQIWTNISRVYKTAELKPTVFKQYLKENSQIIKSSIIFVETTKYGNSLLPLLQEYTQKYRTYYGDDEKTHLELFAAGKLDCLITCHKLSQGIDIPHLKNIILFSSSNTKLETIQRIGRCLRIDKLNPSKRALVIDFIRDTPEESSNADIRRSIWLSEISKTNMEK